MKKNIILEKSFDFALKIIALSKELQDQQEYIISKQLLRSGTSIGANVREANNTMTKKDFIYKMNLAQKECDESIYWLELLYRSDQIQTNAYDEMSSAAMSQLKIIKSIIVSTKRNMELRKP